MRALTLRLMAGMLLLVTNQIVGWGGMLVFGNLARRTGRRVYYFFGAAVYAVSWIMLIAGVYLVGIAQAIAVMKYLPDWAVIAALTLSALGYYVWRRRAKKRGTCEIGNE